MARRILVADESQNVIRNVKVILSQEGYEVTGVADMSGLEAAMGRVRPHLVLVDVELPPADGYMACRAIKEDEATSDVAVLLMVGTFVVLDRAGMDACRAEGFITKPFDPLALKARVREIMRELEDTHRIKLESVPRRAPVEVMAEVEALSGVPEIAADDFGDLQDQDETFPPPEVSSEGATAAAAEETHEHETAPPAPPAPSNGEPPVREARDARDVGGTATPPPRLVAFVQKIRETVAPPQEENLTEAERRIIEDNEAMLREVAAEPSAGAPEEPSDLSSLVSEAEEAARVHAGEEGPAEASPGIGAAPAVAETPSAPVEETPAEAAEAAEAIEAEDESLFDLDEPGAAPGAPAEERAAAPAFEPTVEPTATSSIVAEAPPTAAFAAATTVVEPASAAAASLAAPAAAPAPANEDALVERIVSEVMRRMSDAVVRDVAWDVVPELARLYIEKKLREQPLASLAAPEGTAAAQGAPLAGAGPAGPKK